MGTTFYFEWEVQLMESIQSFMGPVLAKIMEVITFFGSDLFIVFCLGLVYWVYDKKQGMRFGVTLMLTDIIFPVIKNITLRRRPYMDHESIKPYVLVDNSADAMDIAAQGYSFPSGHSASAAGMATTLALIFRKTWLRVLAVVLPLLVGISRFSLGVHYPTDVLAGWVLGYGMAFFMPWAVRKVKNERKLYLILAAVSSLGIFICRSNDYYTAFGSLLGILLGSRFEEKHVNFPQTDKFLPAVLRIAGGIGVYFALNAILKLPFSSELLASASYAQFAVRTVRYGIILFVETAIYPMCFGKIGKK